MRPEFIEFFENARRPKGDRFRHQLYIFLICLGISIFIWLLVRLSKDYIYTVSYHLSFTQVPESLRLVNASDSVVTLNIKVQGFDFFSEQFFRNRKRYLEVNLHDARLKYLDNHLSGYLLSSYISREVSAQNNFPLEIYSISPDTIFFIFERKGLKRMPIIRISPIPGNRVTLKTDTVHIRPDTIFSRQVRGDSPKNKKGK